MTKAWKLFWLQTKLGLNLPGWKANFRSFRGTIKNLFFIVAVGGMVGFLMWAYIYLMSELIELAYGMTMVVTVLMSAAVFAAMLLVLVFGIIRNMGVYYSRDTEFLASLPIKQRSVYAAKFFHAYAGEIVLFAMLVLPPAIILGTRTAVGLFYWIKVALVIVLGPMPAFAVASVVASLLVRISVLGRNRDKINTIGGFVLMLVWIIGWQYLGQAMNHLDTEQLMAFLTGGLVDAIGGIFPPAVWASEAMIYTGSTGMEALLKFLGVAVLCAGLSVLLAGYAFQRSAVAQSETAKKSKRLDMSKAAGNTRSPLMAVYVKEWKYIFRVPIYALNALIQIVVTPIMPIIMFIIPMNNADMGDMDMTMFVDFVNEPESLPWFILIAAAIIYFFATMNTGGSTSYSREGQSIWLLQTMPIKASTIANAKLLFALSISGITCLVSFISMAIIFKTIFGAAMAALLAFLAGLPIIILGNLTDMFRPKLKWESEAKAIKQNASQFIAMLLEFVYLVGLGFFAYYMIGEWGQDINTLLIAISAISVAIAIVAYMVMNKSAQRRLNVVNED